MSLAPLLPRVGGGRSNVDHKNRVRGVVVERPHTMITYECRSAALPNSVNGGECETGSVAGDADVDDEGCGIQDRTAVMIS